MQARLFDSQIYPVFPEHYQEIMEVWEASVRATHHFLLEADIQYFKPLILNEFLKAVDLFCVKDNSGAIVGFMGLHEESLEMLFIHPTMRGKGIGKLLTQRAIELGIRRVDVNEQNPDALGFYQRQGFEVVSRSALDGLGKPYPILHLQLV